MNPAPQQAQHHLNLKAPEGVAAFKKMVKKADVVVENFRPDVKERLGIDYKTLRKVNRASSMRAFSGFGQTGPYAERPGFRSDRPRHGRADVDHRNPRPGGGAGRHPVADLTAGLFCAMGILLLSGRNCMIIWGAITVSLKTNERKVC